MSACAHPTRPRLHLISLRSSRKVSTLRNVISFTPMSTYSKTSAMYVLATFVEFSRPVLWLVVGALTISSSPSSTRSPLFHPPPSQLKSDAVLDDVACMVGCTRTSLNVVASDKVSWLKLQTKSAHYTYSFFSYVSPSSSPAIELGHWVHHLPRGWRLHRLQQNGSWRQKHPRPC